MAEGKRAREVRSVGNTVAMVAGSERIEGIQQIEVAWSRVPGAESTRLHTAHPKPPVPLLLVHSLARFPYPLSFFLHRLPDSLTLLPTCRHSPARNPFPLIPVLTVVISSLRFSSLLFSLLPFSSYSDLLVYHPRGSSRLPSRQSYSVLLRQVFWILACSAAVFLFPFVFSYSTCLRSYFSVFLCEPTV